METMTPTSTGPSGEPQFTLGDRLRRARKNAGLKSKDMAAHFARDVNTVSRWENDETHPSWAEVRDWAETTRAPLAWLRGTDYDEWGHRQSGCVAVELPFGDPDPYRSTLVLAA
jgi:transcriptional regulator with XRE-family HTH domain